MANVITEFFNGCILQEISPMQIQKYLVYLRNDYKTKQGKSLAPKSVRHHYCTLTNIFSYADEQEILVKNPMSRVKAPKKEKKPIDALTPEQAAHFFKLLPGCDLDFRCIHKSYHSCSLISKSTVCCGMLTVEPVYRLAD